MQHVKSKLATVQQTVSLKKLQLDEQHNAAARERALLEQQLLQKEESLQQAQTKVAELLQRYVPPCFSLAIQSFTTAPLHMLITDVFLSRHSAPKNQKRSRCHQAPTSARLSSLTNRKQKNLNIFFRCEGIQCLGQYFVSKRFSIQREFSRENTAFWNSIHSSCLMRTPAPLTGGGGASVIINVSSDTQMQV
jgi:hypothetical protein